MDVLAELGDIADPAVLGRALSRIEGDAEFRAEVEAALPDAPRMQRVGITGAPGSGKSTLLARLVPLLSSGNSRCAVLAVDPTSASSGGAVLADRYRWGELAGTGAFIRSFASRGSFGGLSPGVATAARVLECAGYGPLLIETVGSGQTGFAIAGLADTVVVLLTPESGDGLQLLKAGLLEAGDIFAVNKSDRPGADTMLAEVRMAIATAEPGEVAQPSLAVQDEPLGTPNPTQPRRAVPPSSTPSQGSAANDWQPPALALCAETGAGVEELAEQIAAHWEWLKSLPANHPRRLARLRAGVVHLLRAELDELAMSVLHESEPELSAQWGYGELKTEAALADLLKRAAVRLARRG